SHILYQCKHLKPNTDIVYFGESSNMTTDDKDSVKKSISELVAGQLPGVSLVTIDTFAVHAGIYKKWIEQFSPANKPKEIIITMNLRSFGASWIYSKLESSILKSVRLSQTPFAGFNRLFLALRMPGDKTSIERQREVVSAWKKEELYLQPPFPYKTTKEWDDSMAAKLKNENFTYADSSRIMLACHYIKAFAFNIKEMNPRVKDFDAIAGWAAENKVKLCFNILAENINLADSLVGKELVYLMRKNRDFLVRRYSGKGVVMIDNLEKVEPEYFIDKNWTTEHYTDKGRIKIAKNIVEHLNIK
ncbi:MAG: DUF4843 domain-containing protein, partial [Bacteroidia bacterium]